ncbi:MAG: 2Fe-2S iron-sulfur cluster-binding protein [Phycisphaerales bacterium JB039]
MTPSVKLTIDGRFITASRGQTILEAAEAAGIWIPRLCHRQQLEPYGGCRVCTVRVNGRPAPACAQPVAPDLVVENETEEVIGWRRAIIEMLFVEGNHFCMMCEASGACELQALAYRLGVTGPRYPFLWPRRSVDASHPDVMIDRNRCILCARCERASRDVDGKTVFGFTGRGPDKRLAVNAPGPLAETDLDAADSAVDACPVGAILRKGAAYQTPIGQRRYDRDPIGSKLKPTPGRPPEQLP